MKNVLLVLIGLVIITSAVYAIIVGYPQMRGAIPALLPISENAAEEVIANNSPFQIPDGFSLSVFSQNVPGARMMTYDPNGALLVSLTSEGKIVALPDTDGNGADSVITVAEGLTKPHGITFKDSTLYVAETTQVSTFDYDPITHTASNKQKLVDLPSGGRHFTRSLTFLPYPDENVLLISIGSTCDVCDESDERAGTVMAYELDDEDEPYLQPFATGLRNAVFMTLHPVSGEVWVTEMGRDRLGDDLPPDEINIVRKGGDYGWPICYGQNIHDTDFDKKEYIRNPCEDAAPAHIDLPAHVAPLGLAFIPEEGWPEDWWYDLLVAEHGSWNSTEPVGYKIVRLKLDAQGNYEGTEDFMTGFLKDGVAIGRPADILVQPGGTVYISDDKAGVIYRLARVADEGAGENEPTAPPAAEHDGCVVSGCSSEVCAGEEMVSPCIYKPEFACYQSAVCEKQLDGQCGWTQTAELMTCLETNALDSMEILL